MECVLVNRTPCSDGYSDFSRIFVQGELKIPGWLCGVCVCRAEGAERLSERPKAVRGCGRGSPPP